MTAGDYASHTNRSTRADRLSRWLDLAVFAFLLLTFALAPHSIKQAARACTVATIIFAASLLIPGRRLRWHPLFRPVLVFLLLAALSTAFSSAPDWSWRRMAWFSLMLAVVVAAQTLRTRKRIAALVAVLLLSSSTILVRVGWQYTSGIGVTLAGLSARNPLALHGLQPADIIQAVNAHPARNPGQFRAALQASSSDTRIILTIARGAPLERVQIPIDRTDLDAALRDPGLKIERGHPQRAQAGFYHYVPFAGFMTVIALLAWGLVLTVPSPAGRMLFLILAAGASAAVMATITRTYLATLLLGAFAAFWMVSRRRMRIVALVTVVIAALSLTVWIHRERGLGWVATSDAGTQFRLEMWRDSVPLIVHHPLFGIGLDATLSGKWNLPAFRRFPLISHFHSTPIQLAVDTGLPALIAWLWIAASLFRLLLRALHHLPSTEHLLRGVILGIFAGTVAFYAASLVHYDQGDGEVMILMYILMGTAVAIENMAARAIPGNAANSTVEPVSSPTASAA